MSKKSNGVPTGPRIDPRVEELIRRGQVSKKASEEIGRRLRRLVDQLMKKFPDQVDALVFKLDGERSRLLSEQHEPIRREREERRRKAEETNGESDGS